MPVEAKMTGDGEKTPGESNRGVPTFISLFSGIGALDLGLERAGFRCIQQVESDLYATRVLARHWPNVPRWDDIRTYQPEGTSADLVAGGFPCQDISLNGKRAGITGERSGLFFEAIRVVRVVRPRFVLLENVPGLLAADGGMDAVLGELAQLRYDAQWLSLPAAAFGAPHLRWRVFIIAWDADPNSDRGRLAEQPPRDHGTQPGAVHEPRGDNPLRLRHAVADPQCSRSPGRQRPNPIRAGTEEWPKPARSSWWAAEPRVGRVVDGHAHRVDRLRCLGNAVVPQVAEFVGKIILNRMEAKQ